MQISISEAGVNRLKFLIISSIFYLITILLITCYYKSSEVKDFVFIDSAIYTSAAGFLIIYFNNFLTSDEFLYGKSIVKEIIDVIAGMLAIHSIFSIIFSWEVFEVFQSLFYTWLFLSLASLVYGGTLRVVRYFIHRA